MFGYLSATFKSTFGFYLHQWACLFFVDFLDSTFVIVTVLNASIQKSSTEAPNCMIFFKNHDFKVLHFFPTFFVDLLGAFFFCCCYGGVFLFLFLNRCFGPDDKTEYNPTGEKLSFSQNWCF